MPSGEQHGGDGDNNRQLHEIVIASQPKQSAIRHTKMP